MDQFAPVTRKHRALNIVVRAFDAKTEEQVRERKVNLTDNGQKDWLLSFVLWALLNGKVVEVVNAKDDTP